MTRPTGHPHGDPPGARGARPGGRTPDDQATQPGRPAPYRQGTPPGGPAPGGHGAPADPRRWVALVFISLAQLMVALDATIVNIALPTAQADLGISDADRQWVVTAYTLTFGGLLLLGGRIGDLLGRRRTFLTGLVGFAAASAVGGAAVDLPMLMGARALQGAFGALLAPAALSLLAVTFTDQAERGRAFAVFGGIAGSGGAVGLVLGGALAEHVSWRWCLYVNAPVAVATAVGGWLVLGRARPAGRARLDVPGAVLATAGLAAVVFACSRAALDGWGAATTLVPLAAGVVLLAGFAAVESRLDSPLLPLRLLRDRNRVGAYASVALAVLGMFGMFLFLTYYFQVVRQYSPLRAGLAFLPLSAATLFSSGAIASRLLPRVPPRVLVTPALLVAAVAMALLGRLTVDAGYATHVLPAEILLGLGMGCVFPPAFNTATRTVSPREAGVASAVVNAATQVGASIGTAVLNTVAASATAAYLASRPRDPLTLTRGLVHGYATAGWWAAGVLAAAAVLVAWLVTAPAAGGDGGGHSGARGDGRPAGGTAGGRPGGARTAPAAPAG